MNGNPMQILMQMMSGGNPQEMLQTAMKNKNPQLNAVLNQQKQSGMSMEQFVKQLAQQQGVDINPMVNYLHQMGMK